MIDLYTSATPNGWKITIALDELGLPYTLHNVDLSAGEQRSKEFLTLNPNGRIPVIVDREENNFVVFESGAILLYLAEKFGAFIPQNPVEKTECMSWLFWQMASAPYLGGGFGHFYAYAPAKFEYPINRFAMETKRQLDLLDQRLSQNEFIAGSEYTIADIAIWSWYGQLALGRLYGAAEFLDVENYKNLMAWTKKIDARKCVQRGRMVNRVNGELSSQLHERHHSSDFDLRTQDKISE